MRLVVEGWRYVPHSYAIVHQWQCLSLLRRPDVQLSVIDAPYLYGHWAPISGIFPAKAEKAIKALPVAAPQDPVDAILRMLFPYDFTPGPAPTWVFGTAERKNFPRNSVKNGLAAFHDGSVGVVTPSNWSAEGFRNGGTERSRVAVVPHGIDPALFVPGPERQQPFTFLSVGAMTANKGIDLLLSAFAVVVARYPDCRLVLKGTDAMYGSQDIVKQYLGKLPVQDQERIVSRLVYYGDVLTTEDMVRLYQSADVYVSPYRAEGFNMPVLEAAACGLPVICTAGGPTDDFTNDGFALRIEAGFHPCDIGGGAMGGYLTPSLDHLIAAMITAVEDPSWHRQARLSSTAFIHANFTWDKAVDRLISVLSGTS